MAASGEATSSGAVRLPSRPRSAAALDELELDENDIWDTLDGRREDAESRSDDDSDSETSADVVAYVATAGARPAAKDRFADRDPPAAYYGSLPAWKSSQPRQIMHPAAAARHADAAPGSLPVGGGGGVGPDAAAPAPAFADPGDAFMPPHVYASTYGTYGTASGAGVMDAHVGDRVANGIGSVVSGKGHTLKGRDALKMRTAVLRRTGFVEPQRETPGTPGAAEEPPPRAKTPAAVAGFEPGAGAGRVVGKA